MAGAALLPGHGGFTSGLKTDLRIRKAEECDDVNLMQNQNLSVTLILEMFPLIVDLSSHTVVSDEPEKKTTDGNNKVIISCLHGNS